MENQLISEFLNTLRNSNTQTAYRVALEEFSLWYAQTNGETLDWKLLTKTELEDYVSYLQTVKRYKPTSIYLHISAIRSLMRYSGRIPPVIKVPKQERKAIRALTPRELGKLLACAEDNPRDYAVMCLMAKAGMRVSEVVKLEVGDLELNPKSGWALIRAGKGNKNRRVPLNNEVRQALRAWLEIRPSYTPYPHVFVSRTGSPLSTRDIQRKISDFARIANLEGEITPHVLRHTFATRFLEKNGDLASLQIILGHSNLQTTSRYLHPSENRLMNAVEEI